ncbi:tetratricopeptide repeat protein [Corallococcus sp. CA054B]|uniref:tetratricopeptide repeat protein n=1 Tax=Corallococcus sp. CA054B TaxID=2316734 RepID=UPI0018F30063|nr:tetratricopeptide repeat protein [Corallococcus sp. CA054B]
MRRLVLAWLLGVGLVLVPSGARAEEPGPFQTHVGAARQLYDELEYERALAELSRARRHSSGDADDVLLALYEGVILADLGRTESSGAAFRVALLLQPGAELPLKVSPKVEQRFEAVRQQALRELAKQDVRVPPPVATAPLEPVTSPDTRASPVPTAPEVSTSATVRSRAWIPATVGGVLLVGGGVSYLQARSERSRLRRDDVSIKNAQDVDRSVSRGKSFQTVGLVLAGLALVFLLPKGGVEVRNAQEGERVYVSGVRLDASQGLPEGTSGWLISTAVDGKLHRFGKVPKSEHIDLRTLADAPPQAEARGTLSVTGAQGCRVALGSQVLEGQTPLSSQMPAGREFEVRVTCGGKPDVVRWVMAVPGQGVALDVP